MYIIGYLFFLIVFLIFFVVVFFVISVLIMFFECYLGGVLMKVFFSLWMYIGLVVLVILYWVRILRGGFGEFGMGD